MLQNVCQTPALLWAVMTTGNICAQAIYLKDAERCVPASHARRTNETIEHVGLWGKLRKICGVQLKSFLARLSRKKQLSFSSENLIDSCVFPLRLSSGVNSYALLCQFYCS